MREQEITQAIRSLPVPLQQEVFDFICFLSMRSERQEREEWSDFSLSSAMQGVEDEQTIYTLNDLKVIFQ